MWHIGNSAELEILHKWLHSAYRLKSLGITTIIFFNSGMSLTSSDVNGAIAIKIS